MPDGTIIMLVGTFQSALVPKDERYYEASSTSVAASGFNPLSSLRTRDTLDGRPTPRAVPRPFQSALVPKDERYQETESSNDWDRAKFQSALVPKDERYSSSEPRRPV